MMAYRFRFAMILCLAAGCTQTLTGQFSSSPGFGNLLTRKKVELHRRLPPVVNISGKSVSVQVEGQDAVAKELQSGIEGVITRGDSTIQVGGNRPDLQIVSSITQYAPPKLTSVKQNNMTTDTLTGALAVSFRITEVASKKVVRSGIASTQIEQQTTEGALRLPFPQKSAPAGTKVNSTMDTENALVADVSRQVASYVVNTDEIVPVLLATGGALSGPDKLASSTLWTRNLESLETLTPFPDPREDAYRLYNIGVANEALAYQAQDARAAVKYLQEASIDYGKALAARADEKYFLEPQNRIKTALAHYDAAPAGGPAAATARGADKKAMPESAPGLSNEDVMDMVQAHMDQANIVDNIQSAPKVSFDLTVSGQVQLLKGGVNNQILSVMKQKVRTATSPAGR